MTAPAQIKISVTPLILPHVEAAARAAQAALDDLPLPFESDAAQLRQRDRLGEVLIHTANAHRKAKDIEARLAALQVVAADGDAAVSLAREQAYLILYTIDPAQTHYRPMPPGEVIELIHELIDVLDGDEPTRGE